MLKTIKSKKEFSEVFHTGKRASFKLVRISATRNEGKESKIAFVAAKRLGNAPYRNTCKRKLREAIRLCEIPQTGIQIILFATYQTINAKPNQIAQDISQMIGRIS